ncbi:MAG: acetoacetate decarboxylase family protein [Aquamicrobium sp.]|uniref:acetoacetate decarboxylase family protein n=1 Tax=Aquamicrobium sp. TaxID=1872579 RepID=UPI00349EF31E|nr:acetoacetate decarboxylase family protein [Aquamicrobium sp.]
MTTPAKPPISTPLHHPLYLTTGDYSGDCLGISILMEVDRSEIEKVLAPTPFEFVAPYAWIEAYIYTTITGFAEYEDTFGDYYGSTGVVIPARYGEHTGGYYAHCFKNKDYGTAPGREAMGFPIKYAELRMQKIGRAVTATTRRPTASIDLSLVIGDGTTKPPVDVVRSPHLLLQSIPSVERDKVMLQQIIKRDVSSSSSLTAVAGEPAVDFLPTGSGVDELAWLKAGRPIYGEFFSGKFRGAFGTVLSTTASPELRKRLGV